MDTFHPIWFIVITGAIALTPIFIGLVTSYVKVSVVLGMLRSGLGAQQVPSGMVVMAMSLAMTFYIMAPVFNQVAEIAQTIDFGATNARPTVESLQRMAPLFDPWKAFMLEHAGKREIAALNGLTDEWKSKQSKEGGSPESAEPPTTEESTLPPPEAPEKEAVSLRVLLPAFVMSELKEAFAMGFVLLLPFLVVDLVVANILVGMGMFMVSPVMIALPLKLILFVVSDGWLLLTKGLIHSYSV